MMVYEAIAELMAAHNECDPSEIQMDTTLASLGIDSLDTVELMMQLEEKLECEIELTEKVETVGDLVAFIEPLVRKS